MQDNDGIITTDKFTLIPSSIIEIKSFLNTHLGDSLIEVINIEHCQCECKVKTEDRERIVSISLPTQYIHHELKD